MGDLKLTREAVDDAAFPPDIKQAALNAVEWFINQQEGLLSQVDRAPEAAGDARKQRAALEGEFNRKMSVVYSDPKLQAELVKRLQALDREMEEMARSADRILSKLDAIGVTPEQKAKIAPAVKEGNERLKRVAAKSSTGSTKDSRVREEAVTNYKEIRQKVKQTLTKEQQEKLKKVE